MSTQLPPGWKVREDPAPEEQAKDNIAQLPPGWKVRDQKSTPDERDTEKIKAALDELRPKAIREHMVSPEEAAKFGPARRKEYEEEIEKETQNLVKKREFARGATSGSTFGIAEGFEAARPIDFETSNQYSIYSTSGKVAGSLIPITRLLGWFGAAGSKIASYSPYFQKQVSSLAQLVGIGTTGATAAVLEGVGKIAAKGIEKGWEGVEQGVQDFPTSTEVLEHGAKWVALDVGLQSLGIALGGAWKGLLFAADLAKRSLATGVKRPQLVTEVYDKMIQAGVDMTVPEKVGFAAMEIISAPLTEAEILAAEAHAVKAAKKAEEVALNAARAPVPKAAAPAANAARAEQYAAERTAQMARAESGASTPSAKGLEGRVIPQGFIEKPAATVGTEATAARMKAEAGANPVVTPQDLGTRNVSEEISQSIGRDTLELAETIEPSAANFTKEARALEETALKQKIESVGERAATPQELGNTVRDDLEAGWKAAKEEVEPFYKEAEKVAETIKQDAKPLARAATEELINIERITTKPGAYSSVISTLENIITDAGYALKRGTDGRIKTLLKVRDVPVRNTIEVGKRLNEMIDFQDIEPGVELALGRVVKVAKAEARNGLSVNKEALANFELAEEQYGLAASKYSTPKIIRQIRKEQAGEKVAKLIDSPEAMSKLRDTLSPAEMKKVEREWLERLNKKSHEAAKEEYRGMRKQLSSDARKVAKEVVESKNPLNHTAKKKLYQDAVLDDMSNAITTGTRPQETLKLWKTPKGRQIVEDSFKGSKNWPEVKKYLEKQSFDDMVKSVLTDGVVDPKKMKAFMKDPAMAANIRALGGEEAVVFFKHLDTYVKDFEGNLKLLDHFFKKDEILLAQKPDTAGLLRGREIIKNTKQKVEFQQRETKLGQGALKTQRALADEAQATKGERGRLLLKRMSSKDFPVKARIEAVEEYFKKHMGLSAKTTISAFGLEKALGYGLFGAAIGMPKIILATITYKMMGKFATSPAVRKAWKEAVKSHANFAEFIKDLEKFGIALDTSESDRNKNLK